MLKLQYTGTNWAVLLVSGHLRAERLGELAALIDAERPVALDLGDLIRADEDAVRFLCACERDGIVLRYCPSYIRTWMQRQRAD